MNNRVAPETGLLTKRLSRRSKNSLTAAILHIIHTAGTCPPGFPVDCHVFWGARWKQTLLYCPWQQQERFMRVDAIKIGNNPPDDVNVIVEVPIGGEPIKYELDKAAGTLFVDRFLHTPMRYPGNYGFVPHTLSKDGDPIDVLVANTRPIVPGAVINVRPIGVLKMEDEAGGREQITDG